jgi:hemerythrin-like metal-binding protein
MDDQHGILTDALNELRLAMKRVCSREQVSKLLDQLIEFTRMQLWSEEQLMEETGLLGLAEQSVEHHRLLAQILQSARRLQHGEAAQTSDFLCILHDWFIDHVEGLEQEYGPWLNKHGVYEGSGRWLPVKN